MSYRYCLGFQSDDVKSKLLSEQFVLSEEILKMRFENDLSPYDMANILKLYPNEYMRYECCDLSISVSEYEDVLEKLKKYFLCKPFVFYDLHMYDTVELTNIVTNSVRVQGYLFSDIKHPIEIYSNVPEVA